MVGQVSAYVEWINSDTPSLETSKALHRNTVKVADWHFAQRPHDKRLASFHIDGRIIVHKDGTTTVPCLNSQKSLYWDNALGLSVRKETA